MVSDTPYSYRPRVFDKHKSKSTPRGKEDFLRKLWTRKRFRKSPSRIVYDRVLTKRVAVEEVLVAPREYIISKGPNEGKVVQVKEIRRISVKLVDVLDDTRIKACAELRKLTLVRKVKGRFRTAKANKQRVYASRPIAVAPEQPRHLPRVKGNILTPSVYKQPPFAIPDYWQEVRKFRVNLAEQEFDPEVQERKENLAIRRTRHRALKKERLKAYRSARPPAAKPENNKGFIVKADKPMLGKAVTPYKRRNTDKSFYPRKRIAKGKCVKA